MNEMRFRMVLHNRYHMAFRYIPLSPRAQLLCAERGFASVGQAWLEDLKICYDVRVV